MAEDTALENPSSSITDGALTLITIDVSRCNCPASMSAIEEDLPNDGTKLAEGLKNCAAPEAALATPEPPEVEPPPLMSGIELLVIEGVDPATFETSTFGTVIDGAEICETLGKNGIEL